MRKKLSQMTLEELWRLFPISLTAHNEDWVKQYSEIEETLKEAFSGFADIKINHIGSTAVPGIYAKKIIDVLIEIPENADLYSAAKLIEARGFIIMSQNKTEIALNKGYTVNGFEDKVYHIHLRYSGDNDELYFRDYLKEYPNVAKEYEKLKLALKEKYEFNRDAYTEAKSDFVKKYTEKAKKIYKGRYRRN